MKRSIPWSRLAAEAVVVVGSILLAFAIDAAWDRYRMLEEEREVPLAVQQELQEVGVVIGATRDSTRLARENLSFFLESAPDEIAAVPASEIQDRLYSPLIRQWGAAIPRGGLDAATGSGQLAGVRDPTLRAALARLSSRHAHVDEIRRVIGELDIGTAAVLGEFEGMRFGGFSQVGPETLRAVRQDPRIQGAASAKYAFLGGSLGILDELEASVDETLDLIEAAVER